MAKINKKKQILLDAEKLITKYKDKEKNERIYNKIVKLYTSYKEDPYHDSITDKMYLDKLNVLIDKFYKKNNQIFFTCTIIIFSIIVIFAGYFITDYIYKKSKINNNVIELTSTYNKIFFGSKDEFLLINFNNFDDLVLTREKSKISVDLKSNSSHIIDYTIYIVTDEVTYLKYDVISDNLNYGTNVLKSKNNMIYSSTINPMSTKTINLELWQDENYNLNSQMRIYVDAKIIK